MHELTVVLGLIAAGLHGTAYVLYNLQTKLGQSKPNLVSWSIWAFLAILNVFSYLRASGDVIATFQFFTGSGACLVTFLYVFKIGKFRWPKKLDWFALFLALVAVVVWWLFQSAAWASVIVCIAFVISFIPTFRGVWEDPYKEMPRSWIIWTAAFSITTINIIIRSQIDPDNFKLIALLAPAVLLFLHGSIAVLSTKKRKSRFQQVVE